MFQNSYRYFQDNSVSKLITILSYVFKPTRVLYRCWWQNFIISRWGENVVIKIRKFSFTLFVTNICYQHLLPTSQIFSRYYISPDAPSRIWRFQNSYTDKKLKVWTVFFKVGCVFLMVVSLLSHAKFG